MREVGRVGVKLVADFFRQLPDRLLTSYGLRRAVDQMVRHAVQPQETRAQPFLPPLADLDRFNRRQQIGRDEVLLQLREHIGIERTVIRLDDFSRIHETTAPT